MNRRAFIKSVLAAMVAATIPIPLSGMATPVTPLAPMYKIPLATIDNSVRWMQLLYTKPVMYAPERPRLLVDLKDV